MATTRVSNSDIKSGDKKLTSNLYMRASTDPTHFCFDGDLQVHPVAIVLSAMAS